LFGIYQKFFCDFRFQLGFAVSPAGRAHVQVTGLGVDSGECVNFSMANPLKSFFSPERKESRVETARDLPKSLGLGRKTTSPLPIGSGRTRRLIGVQLSLGHDLLEGTRARFQKRWTISHNIAPLAAAAI
jgi:hypothetical protein